MDLKIKFDKSGRIVPFINGTEITMNESPFLIFLATAGMCSAVYVKAFMQQRGLPIDEVEITQRMNYNQMTNMVKDIDIIVDLPASFPEKYKNTIKNVVAQCPVKRHLAEPPTFNVTTNLSSVLKD
ncbi:OsmC family protein [Lutibacter sp.]|uniref:OsmC family protein n=1 Tax=Lutibacter sp. TaxID=1925666 RepID=UPI0025BF3BCF|nr:OsmC family protein [Lutibacter sp.]MCF6168528.1 OsmC family protein [Lutibacter sp.]